MITIERILSKCSSSFLLYRHQASRQLCRRNVILGIESTFDDTGAAVIDAESGTVVGEALFTHKNDFTKTGGVEAFKAQDIHREQLPLVVNKAMSQAGVSFQDLDAIATATKPGLYLSLKEGLEYSKSLIAQYKLPFIPVHHMEAHLLTARMISPIKFPFITLLISGGHCLLCVALELGNYLVLGKCLDKPPGAVIDRIARLVYPSQDVECRRNGKYLEQVASNGDRKKVEAIPPPIMKHHQYSCDFSFSGLLSNTMMRLEQLEESSHADIAASFQHSLSEHLMKQVSRAIIYSTKRGWFHHNNNDNNVLVVSGGVACNSYIRHQLQQLCEYFGWKLVCPPPQLCTDNGIMIAWTGLEYWRRNRGISSNPMAERYEAKCDVGPYISDQVKEAAVKIPNFSKLPSMHTSIIS